jgi:hypothetical protein
VRLAKGCWAAASGWRPSFADVVAELGLAGDERL